MCAYGGHTHVAYAVSLILFISLRFTCVPSFGLDFFPQLILSQYGTMAKAVNESV